MEIRKNIDFDDIENIKVVASQKVLMKGQEVLDLFSRESNIRYQDILISLGLANGKYSRDIEEKCFQYLLLEKEADKKAFLVVNTNLNEKFIKEVIEYKEKLAKDLADIPSKLMKFVIESSSKQDIFNLILDTLDLATGEDVNRETLANTDVVIIAELLIRIVKKPKACFEKALFLSELLTGVKTIFQSLNFTMQGKKPI